MIACKKNVAKEFFNIDTVDILIEESIFLTFILYEETMRFALI